MAPTGGPHLSAAVRKRRSAGPRGKAGPYGDGPEIWAAAEKKIRKEGNGRWVAAGLGEVWFCLFLFFFFKSFPNQI
jgi:hypothetical protein